MKFRILLLTVLLPVLTIHGQTEYLVTVNPATFSFAKVDSLPGVMWINVPTSTFDYVNHRYIVQAAAPDFNFKLYSIDVNTGNVISNPLFPILTDVNDNVVYWQFSNSLNKLLALHWDNSEYQEYFVSINTGTGVFTIIDTLPGVNYIDGSATFDDIHNRYIFKSGDAALNWTLIAVDAANGNILSNPPFPNPPGNVVELQYGNSTDQLYALHWDSVSSTERLAALNLTTGAYTDINTLPGVAFIQSGYTTFDDFNDRYIFKGGDASGNWYLYSVNAISGSITYNPIFPTFSGSDNIIMTEVDSTTGIMYALHWESVTNGIDAKEENKHILNFFPNPFNSDAKLILDKAYKEIILFVYNTSGQMVKKVEATNSKEVTIHGNDLAVGEYFISVICDHMYNGTVKTSVK